MTPTMTPIIWVSAVLTLGSGAAVRPSPPPPAATAARLDDWVLRDPHAARGLLTEDAEAILASVDAACAR